MKKMLLAFVMFVFASSGLVFAADEAADTAAKAPVAQAVSEVRKEAGAVVAGDSKGPVAAIHENRKERREARREALFGAKEDKKAAKAAKKEAKAEAKDAAKAAK